MKRLDTVIAEIAVREIGKVNSGTEFFVRDLLMNAGWELITLVGRQQVGLRFYEIIKEQNLLGTTIEEIGKIDDATKYRKL